MSHLTVKQWKVIYAVIGIALIVPIVLLGAPAGRMENGTSEGMTSFLAKSRSEHDLGEASLGDVDPTSATMNLVLLGLRGVAASVLWNQADHYKDTKNFSLLQSTVESIILLQPHFKAVWEFQAWNLAFNVSAECDQVSDRYYWVKQGAKFLKRGTERNRLAPELFYCMGDYLGRKIGNSDEHEAFREFFLVDPDTERWKNGPDEELNPEGKDNYLVAREWYQKANDTLDHPGVEQHKMDLSLFVAYPYRSLMDYAKSTQKDGLKIDLTELPKEKREEAYRVWAETIRSAWEEAYKEWVNIYGRRRLPTSAGGVIVLENDEAGLAELAQIAESENRDMTEKVDWQERYRKMTSYPFWKKHCDIEKREAMMQARYQLAEGRRLFREVQDFEESQIHLEKGLENLAQVIKEYQIGENTNVLVDDENEIVEDAFKSILIWQQVLELNHKPVPENFPLKALWNDPSKQELRDDLTQRFLRWQGKL
ncbi:hypothetical protein [Planctomicrobium sp. SH664]|uniref:hypothetical protein n=1 Tax=Planctomicrobium sp. SH664 TaxID=3448125 RepID=UPI003F5C2603